MSRGLKTDLLDELLRRTDTDGVIVFARTKRGADRLARQLEKRGHAVAALHGDRTQSQRERALRDLKRGRIAVLVATDIASRGIDVEDLTHVINYDVPMAPEDYVHRIGRTARADAKGDAFTLMSPEEDRDMKAIERFIGKGILRVTIPDFDYKKQPTPMSGEERGHGGRGRDRERGGSSGGGGRGRTAATAVAAAAASSRRGRCPPPPASPCTDASHVVRLQELVGSVCNRLDFGLPAAVAVGCSFGETPAGDRGRGMLCVCAMRLRRTHTTPPARSLLPELAAVTTRTARPGPHTP